MTSQTSLPRQRGVFVVLFAVLLPLIVAILAMALGLAQLYNRKVELQGMANAVALAAARELDGSSAGLARAAASARVTAERFKVGYGAKVTWSDAAIRFGASPNADGVWESAAARAPGPLYFAKVDTAMLDPTHGAVTSVFLRWLASGSATVNLSGRAIAGRTNIKVTPLAVCALEGTATRARGDELVEYGFRRGVVYDLKNLNPLGATPQHFVIDPLVPPGGLAFANNTGVQKVGPFVCSGRMWMPSVLGGRLRVARGIPASLHKQLNSRFGQYQDGVCSPAGAPPDRNVRVLDGFWMKDRPAHLHTLPWLSPIPGLMTVAEAPSLAPGAIKPAQWGALWGYARAARHAATEPAGGYASFGPADMAALYGDGVAAPDYPVGRSPYQTWVTPPSSHAILAEPERRVLNIPLLACPVTGSTATALAVGRFFMVAPSSATSIPVEFAGIVTVPSLTSTVELYP